MADSGTSSFAGPEPTHPYLEPGCPRCSPGDAQCHLRSGGEGKRYVIAEYKNQWRRQATRLWIFHTFISFSLSVTSLHTNAHARMGNFWLS